MASLAAAQIGPRTVQRPATTTGTTTPGVPLPTFDPTAQNPFSGAVPRGPVTPEVIDLSLTDALDRALQNNLGLILAQQGSAQVRAARLQALSQLLPNVNAHVAEQVQQNNLLALGVPPSFFAGMSPIVGPFSFFDARVTATEGISLRAIRSLRASIENVRASELSVRGARELVVVAVGVGYIQALAEQARIDAISAQLRTAEALYQQTLDMKNAGTVAGLDVLRAQVEMQVQQQRLLAARNNFEKAKLTLARAIGLPTGQQFRLTTEAPYQPPPPLTLDEALERAFRNRPDYQSALALRRSAELTLQAASAARLPSLQFIGDYGDIGPTPGNSHGTFTAAAALQIPIFQGGRIRSDIQTAEAVLKQRQAQVDDLRGRVEFEVRSAFLDLNSAAEQVQVAQSSVALAQQEVEQARDRFAAGVTNNLEVVQAQAALAVTNENYIASLLAHNLAKLELAGSLGIAETAVRTYLGGKR
ncbi:MAG: TolC family protein [Terriglobales bacterium]